MRFLKSFLYAFRGIVYCINNERNMRVHTVVALYVLVFSAFFRLSPQQYAVLLLTISAVIGAEMGNTALERLADLSAGSYDPLVRIVKDVAAGAVFVCAAFSVAVGICLFWQPAAFARILSFFLDRLWLVPVLLVSLAAALLYIVRGPLGIRDMLHRAANKRKKPGKS